MRGGGQLSRSAQYDPLSQTLSDDEDDKTEANGLPSTLPFNKIQDVSVDSRFTMEGTNIKKPMSRLRTFAFLLSLLFACATVAAFLWLLPCEANYPVCAPSNGTNNTFNWTRIFPALAFSTGFELVNTNDNGHLDVMFAFHSRNISTVNTASDMGVMMLNGDDGHVIWRQSQYVRPTHISCTDLDVNGDGITDCIFVGNHVMLSAVNASNNYTFWYFHDHLSLRRLVWISSPAVVSDLNADGIDDLLVSCRMNDEDGSASRLAFVSGSMGELLGRPVLIPQCSSVSSPISIVTRDSSVHFVLSCESDERTSIITASLSQLINSSFDSDPATDLISFSEIYTFINGKCACLLPFDVDFDSVDDILAAGGDGEIVALSSNTKSVKWFHQRVNHTIFSCNAKTIKTKDEANVNKIILITYGGTPKESLSQPFNSVLECISSINGTVLWSYSNSSLLSPVQSQSSHGLIAFKSTSRVNPLNDTSISPLIEEQNGGDNSKTELLYITQHILFFNIHGQIIQKIQVENSSIACYDFGTNLPECLPLSTLTTSSIVTCEDKLVLYSVGSFVDSADGNWNLKIVVSKRLLLLGCED